MTNPFRKAEKSQARLRLALIGVSGSGKTYSALGIASAFGRVAVIDTEHGSASKYADTFDFDTLELANYHPQQYIDAIRAAGAAGYDALVIDSLSHAWNGAGGTLELVDRAAAKSGSGNTYAAWRNVTPLHSQLVEAMLAAPMHVVVTMRSKAEYVLEKDERGKNVPRKVGMAPVQRDGMEYEFDVVGDLDLDHLFTISKSRIPALDGQMVVKPGAALGEKLKAWLAAGKVVEPETPAPTASPLPASPASTAPTAKGSDDSAKPDSFDAAFPPAAPQAAADSTSKDAPPPNAYTVTEVKVIEQGNSHLYLLKAGRANITLYGGDMFRAVGISPDFWKNNPGKWFALKPALTVIADLDGAGDKAKWIVHDLYPVVAS